MSSKTKPPDKGGTEEVQNSNSAENLNKKKIPNKATVTIEIPKWVFFSISILVGLISVMMGGSFAYLKILSLTEGNSRTAIADKVGMEGVMLFDQHDRDSDGYLSLEEFEPLIYRLLEINVTAVYDVPIDDDDEIITVKAYFEPLKMETMTKDFSEMFSGLDSFIGLKNWKTPIIQAMNFGARHFSVFLPPNKESVTLGDVYFMVEKGTSLLNAISGASLSSNRYYPPKVKDSHIMIHRLLSMFHSRPFIETRFAPSGSVACVRAQNDKYFDIHFRIHGEFQLNEPPYHPYWFTPAQFTGNIIISPDGSHVVYFNLYVPSDKKLNVDMEWLNGPKENENMEVDIGFMPLMKLNNTASSALITEEYMKDSLILEDTLLNEDLESIVWSSSISEEEARRKLEIEMYPFKKIPYYNFTSAFTKAEEEKKLVHSILLWGALDDQSC